MVTPRLIGRYGDNYDNWCATSRMLLKLYPSDEWLLTCEDDIEIDRDAAGWILSHYNHKESHGFLSLYTSGRYRRWLINKPSGIYEIKDTLWGACCLLWHREKLAAVLDTIFQDRKNNVDGAISRAVQKLGLKQMFCLPSLAEHIGEVSSMGDRPYNENRRAIRPDWSLKALVV